MTTTSRREPDKLSSDKAVEETNATRAQPEYQMWRHTVVGVAAPLDLQLQDKGARVIGKDFQARSGERFSLPIPPLEEQRESPEWNRPDRLAMMSATQVFELFNWSEFKDPIGEPLTHNLDFITLVMLATKPE